MPTHTRTQCLLLGLVSVLLALLPAMAQDLTGAPGLPEATTPIDGRDPLALPQPLGGTLGGEGFGANDSTPRLVAQTSGTPATARTTAAAPEGQAESASELNRPCCR